MSFHEESKKDLKSELTAAINKITGLSHLFDRVRTKGVDL